VNGRFRAHIDHSSIITAGSSIEASRQPVDALGGARDSARKAAVGLVELTAPKIVRAANE
jgi:hypothetical protein